MQNMKYFSDCAHHLKNIHAVTLNGSLNKVSNFHPAVTVASNDIQRREKNISVHRNISNCLWTITQLPESTLFTSIATFNAALEPEEAMLEHKVTDH